MVNAISINYYGVERFHSRSCVLIIWSFFLLKNRRMKLKRHQVAKFEVLKFKTDTQLSSQIN